jgi:predicted solute-binding protein
MNNHIKLYVNDFSLALGKKGKESVRELFRIAGERQVIPKLPSEIFLTGE